ncbi:hypothetical protein Tco_0580170 [Tanacetum coccineum]
MFCDSTSSSVAAGFLASVSLLSSEGVSARKSASLARICFMGYQSISEWGKLESIFEAFLQRIRGLTALMLSIEAARYITKASPLIGVVSVGNTFMNSFISWKASSVSVINVKSVS